MAILDLSGPPGPEPAPRAATPVSWNPFVLWGQCFQWSGRFAGRQLFVVFLSLALVGLGIPFLLVATGLSTPDRPGSLSARAPGLFLNAWMIVAFVTSVGAVVRRLHDLALGAWLALLALVPCLNAVFLLYVLLAPGMEGVEKRAPLSVVSLVKAFGTTLGFGALVALSLPGLLRSRQVAHENAVIGDLRALVTAQVGYRDRNGGEYEGRWECLARPSECLPGDTGPPLLDRDDLRSPKLGYTREFVAGPPAARPPARSATSTRGFAIVARPVSANGGRTFCTDASGRLCRWEGETAAGVVEKTPVPEGVRCAAACVDLR